MKTVPNNERKYAVRTSAHGSDYLPENPERFDLTFTEAEAQVKAWKSYADTVGGDAIVVERENSGQTK